MNLTNVVLNKQWAFKYANGIHKNSCSSLLSSPIDITPALEHYLPPFSIYFKGSALQTKHRLNHDIVNQIENIMVTDAFLTFHALFRSYVIDEGVVDLSSSAILQIGLDRVIEVDVDKKMLLRVNDEDLSGIQHNQTLDLSGEGDRWEGDVLNRKPYGWGVLYDKNSNKVYEGFRIDDVNVCYGRSYYADNGVVEYEGMICEGKRWGRGTQYNRNGEVMYDGEWLNDEHAEKRVEITKENQLLHNHIEELIVNDNCCNEKEWNLIDFSTIPELRVLEVGDDCFENVNEVKLIGLHELERVLIGKNSFTKDSYNPEIDGIDENRHFYLKNSEKLKELKIGYESFADYSVCEIENVPSLEVIEMGALNEGSDNFYYASLELKSE